MTSSRSETSSPILWSAPPQHGQSRLSGSTTISTRGRCAGSDPAVDAAAPRARRFQRRVGGILVCPVLGNFLGCFFERELELIRVEPLRAPAEHRAAECIDDRGEPRVRRGNSPPGSFLILLTLGEVGLLRTCRHQQRLQRPRGRRAGPACRAPRDPWRYGSTARQGWRGRPRAWVNACGSLSGSLPAGRPAAGRRPSASRAPRTEPRAARSSSA